jgi:hypothetical protein
VDDKAVPGAGRALLRRLFVAAEFAEARRPGKRHHVEIERRRCDRQKACCESRSQSEERERAGDRRERLPGEAGEPRRASQ